MIEYKEVPGTNIIEFSVCGKFTAEEYHDVAAAALKFIKTHTKIRVLKRVEKFEGFDFAIFKEKLLPEILSMRDSFTHVAVVADEKWMEQLSMFLGPVFPYRIRCFKLSEMEEAREWLRAANDYSIEVTSDSKGNCMCFKVTDKLTHRDYEDVLIPTLESVIAESGKARLLVDFGEHFHGFEVAAMWDDTKFGFTHREDFERVAIVGGPSWSKWAARLGEVMMPCEVKAFASSDYAKALEWVKAPVPAKV